MVVNILGIEAQFLIEHFVGSREAEALKSPYAADGIGSHEESAQVDGQSGSKAKDLASCGDDALLVFGTLIAEKSFGRHTYHTYLDAILAKQLCSGDECAHFGTIAQQDNIEIGITPCHHVAAPADAVVGVVLGKVLDGLSAQDECASP